jgi:hypothetical protein
MQDSVQTVKREETGGNDPENGSPDADRGGEYVGCVRYENENYLDVSRLEI